MNFTRASSSITDEELAHFARAIAIPVRVTILRAMLQERDWLCAGSFIAIPFTLASIENNLLAMKKPGLLEMRYANRIPHYRLNEVYLNLCSQRFADLMNLSCTGYLPQ